MSVCTSIEKVNDTSIGELLSVIIDNTEQAYWFYEYAEALKFLNQNVIVEFRNDMYNGNICRFIKTFTIPTIVNTLDKHDNMKLFVDQVDSQANLSFNEIGLGETRQGCIVFCSSQEYKSSANAVWMELLIRDKLMHVSKLRVFGYDNPDADFAGKYVMTALSRNKYGFQSELVAPVQGTIPINPELTIAEEFISNFFLDDEIANSYILKYNLIQRLKEKVDYEMGYGLVRLAMELSLCEALCNITKDVDLKAVGQAILCSRGYLTHESVLSPTVNNVMIAQQFTWPNRRVVVQCLDTALEEKPDEAFILNSIKNTVDKILEVRKGFK